MHRETARVAEKVEEARTFAGLGRAGQCAEAILHFEAHMAHVEEQSRIHRIEQVHMKTRAPLAHDAHGILTRAKSNFHRSIFQGLARARETLLHHDANGIERLDNGLDDFPPARKHFRPEKLHLEPVSETVERKARETVGSPVHDAISIGHLK